MSSTRLYLNSRFGRPLCQGLSIGCEVGTITGIMGPAGAGKSVFLKLLCGYFKPSHGAIFLDGMNVHRDYNLAREHLGYVPQSEIMIPELSVAASLDYRMCLNSACSRSDRVKRMKHVLTDLGFGDNLEQILRQKIGKPEWQGDYLSGGERRRVNIAHELLNRPRILILDEPTSGLAASDAERVVALLRDLADEENMTVILTIHQPGREIFCQLDDLLVVSWGGRPAYYGRADRAVEYFEKISGIGMKSPQNPAEFIVDFVRDPVVGKQTVACFDASLAEDTLPFLRIPLADADARRQPR